MLKIIGLQNGIVLQREDTNHCDSWITITDAAEAEVAVDIGILTETESSEKGRRFHC